MRKQTLLISMIAIMMAGLALNGCTDRPDNSAATNADHAARTASRKTSPAEKKTAHAAQKGIVMEIRDWGHEASSGEEVAVSVKRKIKLADERLAGGKPIFRTDGDAVAVIYPDAWITSSPWMWPGQEPSKRYAQEVAADNEHPLNPGQKTEKVIDLAGNPGYCGDGGYNINNGVSTPRPAYLHWAQDGIEYNAYGFIPLEKLISIAESVAKSN